MDACSFAPDGDAGPAASLFDLMMGMTPDQWDALGEDTGEPD